MPSTENGYTDALKKTLKHEGGVDTNAVLGSGISNFGVTQRSWDGYAKSKGIPTKSVKELKPEEVATFYKDEYYDKPGINMLPPILGQSVFDFGVNAGPGTAIKHLQRMVGVKDDGVLGPKTLAAVKSYDELDVLDALLDSRLRFYQDLVKQNPKEYGKFLKGWTNRVEAQRPKGAKRG